MSQNTDARENREIERFYHRVDGAQISGVAGREQCIECPDCGLFTEIDPPTWDCGNCGQTVELFVGAFVPAQNTETGADCADANDDRTLSERINDEMVVGYDQHRDQLRELQNQTGLLSDRLRSARPAVSGFLDGVKDDLREAERMLIHDGCADANEGSDDGE